MSSKKPMSPEEESGSESAASGASNSSSARRRATNKIKTHQPRKLRTKHDSFLNRGKPKKLMKDNKFPVGPYVLALFIFLVVGSALFGMLRNVRSGVYEG